MHYSAKEKIKHMRDLLAVDHAEADLELLKLKAKDLYQLAHWSKYPKKYARDILASLLDLVTAEDVRLNRRKVSGEEEAERLAKEEEERKAKEEAERKDKEEENESEYKVMLDEKEDVIDDLNLQLDEKEDENEELKNQVAELEHQVEDLHEQNLQEPAEKKSRSRGKKSTQK